MTCFFFILKVVYWDAYDGSAIRELEGLLTGSINAMDISQSGTHFVTGTGLRPACYYHDSLSHCIDLLSNIIYLDL